MLLLRYTILNMVYSGTSNSNHEIFVCDQKQDVLRNLSRSTHYTVLQIYSWKLYKFL